MTGDRRLRLLRPLLQATPGAGGGGAVDSVNGRTGAVTLSKADVGLESVDNTADAAKAVLSAAKLTTARAVSMTGDVSWTVTFDGSGGISAAGTLAAVNSNTGTFGGAATVPQISVNGKGLVTGVAAVGIAAPWADITGKPAAVTALSGVNTGDQDLSGYQPLDSDLTAIAALATTPYGRSLLTLADAAADTAGLNAFTSTLKGLAPASGGGLANFLRADGTWVAPAGGTDPWTYLKLAADYNNATTTFADINDGTTFLRFTPAANADWTMEARLLVWTTAAANLPRVGVAIAAGATRGMGGANVWQAGATATASVHANGAWSDAAGVTAIQLAAGGVLTASVPYLCEITAAGRAGASPTAISLQMACETAAASTCYIKRGSFLRHRTI